MVIVVVIGLGVDGLLTLDLPDEGRTPCSFMPPCCPACKSNIMSTIKIIGMLIFRVKP